METDRDRIVRQWLSTVLRQDDPNPTESTCGVYYSHPIQGPRGIRKKDSRRRRSFHQDRDKEPIPHPREELRDGERRDKRRCTERTERIQSTSNSPCHLHGRFTLDTPFRDFAQSQQLQRPRTTIVAEPHPAPVYSSSVYNIQKPQSRKFREHFNIAPCRENSREAELVTASADPKPSKGYGRKPRHKTRLDRYEPKDGRNLPRKSKDDKVKKSNPGKGRRRLSKAEIGDEFKAPNIKQDRLALASKPGLGLFRNGKASSPKRRRDLPDLSFSEMGFLARQKDREGRNQSGEDLGKEISHYFSQLPPVNRADGIEPGRERVRGSQIANSSCSALDASKTARPRPVRRPEVTTSSVMKHHTRSRSSLPIPRARESEAQGLNSDGAKVSPQNPQNVERSTTYFSWSESGHHVSEPREINGKLIQTAARADATNHPLRRSLRGNSCTSTHPSHFKAENIVFQNASLTGVCKAHSPSRSQKYLTLDDLHNLADTDAQKSCDADSDRKNVGSPAAGGSLSNGENEANSPKGVTRQSQSGDRENNPAVIKPRNGCNSPIDPSGYLGAGPTNFAKATPVFDSGLKGYKYRLFTSVEQNEPRIETSRPHTPQADEIRINNEDSTSPSKKCIESNNTLPRQFLSVRKGESHFPSTSVNDKANEHCLAFYMPEDRQRRQELDENTLHDSHLDFLGLDSFDREVLETGKLNATLQEGDLCGYEDRLLSFLPPNDHVREETMLDSMLNGASCMQDATPVDLVKGGELDDRPPIAAENRRYGILTPRGNEYPEAARPPSVVCGSSGRHQIYEHGYLGGNSKSALVNGNLEQGTWVSGTRSWLNDNKSPRALRDGSLDRLSRSLDRQEHPIRLCTTEERKHAPVDFWRPNRLY